MQLQWPEPPALPEVPADTEPMLSHGASELDVSCSKSHSALAAKPLVVRQDVVGQFIMSGRNHRSIPDSTQ